MATYYVRTDGQNIIGRDGLSIGTAWLTPSYATSRVSAGNHTIYVADGTYTDSLRIAPAIGVSIVGESKLGTIINSTYAASSYSDGAVYLVSTSITDGNQSISNLTLTGSNYTSARGIYTRFRNNITINDCIINKFDKSGINAYSTSLTAYSYVGIILTLTDPTINYTSGLRIYNCTIDDNTESPDNIGECNLRFSGYTNFEIYNNTFSNTTRVAPRSVSSDQVTNGSFHDNILNTRETISGAWLFAMELWTTKDGGFEIYDNDFNGGGTIDIGGTTNDKGIYNYSVSIHDNDFELSTLVPYNSTPTVAITLEAYVIVRSAYIYNNHIKNFPWGINLTLGITGASIEDIYVYTNIIEGSASSDTSWASFGIGIVKQANTIIRDNINIWNNTIIGNQTYSFRGIYLSIDGINTNINFKNNIIEGFVYGIRVEDESSGNTGTVDNLHIDYNLLHSNGSSDQVSFEAGLEITNYTNIGHVIGDPLFIGGSPYDFHLSSSSSIAYHAGIDVGLITDYDGVSWNTPPTIGAYECTIFNTYYVSTTGSDSNLGTISSPWLTWGKAFTSTSVNAGDIVLFRGGTYPMTVTTGAGYAVTRAGTSNNWITYSNYPGEVPILDCDAITPSIPYSSGVGADTNVGANYIKFIGLTIRNVWQKTDAHEITATAFGCTNGYFTFENCTAYNIDGHGFNSIFVPAFTIPNGTHTFINCDAYSCSNTYAVAPALPGNAGSGFASYNFYDSQGYAYFINCRAWQCGDQGFSLAGDNYISADGCWSFDNGLLQGDGHGFKLGWVDFTSSNIRRVVTNCIAANNRVCGITTNDQYYPVVCHMNIYNNFLYHNGYYLGYESYGFGVWVNNTTGSDTEELFRVFKNNLAYDNALDNAKIDSGASYTHDHNSWDTFVTITNSDFASLDSSQLSASRQSDGSLPIITFGKPTSSSNLVGAGINVGLIYDGANNLWNNPPSIGAYEYVELEIAPVADFYSTITNIYTNDFVSFVDSSTNIPVSWSWNFGDTGTSTLQNPTHYYTVAGVYTVTLIATNAYGSDSEIKVGYISVTDPPPPELVPIAAFTVNDTTIHVGETIYFTDQTLNDPTSWSWNFGDSTMSYLQNPSHNYITAGTYTVTLTSTNPTGSDTETKVGYIIVSAIPLPEPDPIIIILGINFCIIEPTDVQYVYYDNGVAYWRKGVRNGAFVLDKTLTPIGFMGIEDIDWECVKSIS